MAFFSNFTVQFADNSNMADFKEIEAQDTLRFWFRHNEFISNNTNEDEQETAGIIESIAKKDSFNDSDIDNWLNFFESSIDNCLKSIVSCDESRAFVKCGSKYVKNLALMFRRQTSRLKNEAHKNKSSDNSLPHLIILTSALATLTEMFWQSTDERNEEDVRQQVVRVNNILFKDGVISEREHQVLDAIYALSDGFFSLAAFNNFINIFSISEGFSQTKKDNMTIEFADNKKMYLKQNSGMRGFSPGHGHPLPPNYALIKNDDPKIGGRSTKQNCFEFALNHENEWCDTEDWINNNYHSINLKTEPARIGDVVVYFSIEDGLDLNTLSSNYKWGFGEKLEIHHTAVITKIDNKGKPIKVMGKFGFGEKPVYEHPISQAPLYYGSFWTIIRKKDHAEMDTKKNSACMSPAVRRGFTKTK